MIRNLDTEARKRLLEEKFAANGQRNRRIAHLRSLPMSLRTYMEKCPFIVTPEAYSLFCLFQPYPDGLGNPHVTGGSRFHPIGYQYREFAWEEKLLKAAKAMGDKHDEAPALFYVGGPIYKVRFGWVRDHLDELWEYCAEEIGVITEERDAGIVISNYCGYLEEDINPDEVVYELGIWEN